MKKNHILWNTAIALGKENKKRDLLLMGVIALSVMALFVLLSLTKGRIGADSLKIIRDNGTAANAVLNDVDEEQAEAVSSLSYVGNVCREKQFGIWYQGEQRLLRCAAVHETDFKKVFSPAYVQIMGSYPKEENEVMLPLDVLTVLGIENPEVGMEIPGYIVFQEWKAGERSDLQQKFLLSGYYETVDLEQNALPTAWFAADFTDEQEIEHFQENLYLQSDSFWFSVHQMEAQLNKDVVLEETQQWKVLYAGNVSVWLDFAGNFVWTGIQFVLILVSVYLLISNVVSLSSELQYRQYGLMKMVGINSRQLRIVFFLEYGRIIASGILLGMAAGTVLIWTVLPDFLKEMYLLSGEAFHGKDLFSVNIMLFSVAATFLSATIAVGRSIKPILILSPVETMHYGKRMDVRQKKNSKKDHIYEKENRFVLLKVAGRKVFGNRRQFIFTIAALFVGIEAALLSVMICRGMDQTNRIEAGADFEVGVTKEAVERYIYENDGNSLEEMQSHELMSEELISKLVDTAQCNPEEMQMCIGTYGMYDYESEALLPSSTIFKEEADTGLTILIVSDEWMNLLAKYAKKHKMPLDLDMLRDGAGFVWLCDDMVTDLEKEKTGSILRCSTFDSNGVESELVCSGCFDVNDRGFPQLDLPWDGRNLTCIGVSEATFKNMGAVKQIYHVSMWEDGVSESVTKDALSAVVKDCNQASGGSQEYYLSTKSDELAEAQSYILATRVVMGSFCGILIFVALIHFTSTVATGIVTYRKEYDMMRKLGMSGRQLRSIFVMEGLIYSGTTLSIVALIGTGILKIAGVMIRCQVDYFVIYYPAGATIIIAAGLILVSVGMPMLLYRKVVFYSQR